MTVITEDMLRIKRLKKELEDGTDFVFPVDCRYLWFSCGGDSTIIRNYSDSWYCTSY